MGASNSVEAVVYKPASIASVLQQMSTQTIDKIAAELLHNCRVSNKDDLRNLSTQIFNRAVKADADLCFKYVELVKSLCDNNLTVYEEGNQAEWIEVTFKEIFVNFSLNEFQTLTNNRIESPDRQKSKVAHFFCNLFIADLVSSCLMCHLISLLEDQFDVQKMLLTQIMPKVMEELKKPDQDRYAVALRRKMDMLSGISPS